MNIKTRLTKIEDQLPKPSNDCECFDKQNEAWINQAYGELFNKSHILPDDVPIEGVCAHCKKTIPIRIKEMYEMLVECYGDGAIV